MAETATRFVVRIEGSGETFACGGHEPVLSAMEQLRRRAIPVGCRNGGCGICKVRVIAGGYVTRKMSRGVVTLEDEASGYVLACKLYPRSDLVVAVVGKAARASHDPGGANQQR